MMDIKWIINCINKENYFFSQHADKERMNDNLLIAEIEEAICTGSILESYEDDVRGSSCLVVGFRAPLIIGNTHNITSYHLG